MNRSITACVLIIGNEILSGRTQDTNLNFLAGELNQLGIRVKEARVIGDDETTIIDTLNYARTHFDYVFTTGGIGPTHDDITSACVAKAFGLPHGRNPEAVEILKTHYKPDELNEARLKMAETPNGAILIANPISKAPGFQVENVFVMAGVPKIVRAMFDDVKGRLKGGLKVHSLSLSTDLREGTIAKPLSDIQDRFEDIEIGSYPYFKEGDFGVSLVIRGQNITQLENCRSMLQEMIESCGGRIILS